MPATGELVLTYNDHPKNVAAVQFTQDGHFLASGGIGGDILVMSVPDGALIQRLKGHSTTVTSLALSLDGKLLISTGYDGTIRYWNSTSWVEEKSIPIKQRGLFPINLSPDGKVLAVGCEFMVKVFRMEDGTQIDELPVDAKGVYAVAFSPDGKFLASGSADKIVRVWEVS